jgi:hypothetical protein
MATSYDVARRFLRGLRVDTVHEAITQGHRTHEEWRDFLDADEEHRRIKLSVRGKLFREQNLENLEALRWQILEFLVADSPRTDQEIKGQFATSGREHLRRALGKLCADGLVAVKTIEGQDQFHITGDGLCEVEYRRTKLGTRDH